MKSFTVIRTHFSPYHGPHFLENERKALEKLPGIQLKEIDKTDLTNSLVLITNTHTQLKSLPQALLNKTELIIHSNSGYDHFAQEVECWKNIPVVVGHEIRAQAVAEYCLACLFERLTELPQHLVWDKSRNWNRPLIKNQSILIFGYGHIGKILSNALKALGAKVTVVDPYKANCLKTWNEVDLKQFRVVMTACSLNSTTKKIFNETFFAQAHPKLVFINGARGKLVDEKSLREFLLSHPEAQAFLDVFEKEPFEENWHSFPQVWKTSHIAGVSQELDDEIINFEVKTLRDFIELDSMKFKEKYQHELLQNKWHQGELI